ncbi:MAG: DoxX family protein [Candidatus Korobacteraceae bacterium]
MAVLIVLFGSLLLYRALGAMGIAALQTWQSCARFALATMFLFTATAHFTSTRKDLIAMVPPAFPRPDLLVTITGILEAAGALGLLLAPTRPWAAWGLILLLLAMFPANVSAALRGVQLRGSAATPLWIRTPLQILFVAWAWWVR